MTVFVSVDATRSDETAVGTVAHEDLCVVRQGTPARVLLAGTGPGDLAPDRTLASFGHLVFSPDGTRLFFTTAAWVTSGAAHAVDLDTGKESFLFDGAIVAPITKGPSAGHYLASHYRLDADHPIDSPHYRGRMETWSLVTKDGRTLRRLTDAEAQRLGAPGP